MILYYIVGDDGDARADDIGPREGRVITHRTFKDELFSKEGRDRIAKNHDVVIVSILTYEHQPNTRNFDRSV